jgi:hypothetical protein
MITRPSLPGYAASSVLTSSPLGENVIDLVEVLLRGEGSDCEVQLAGGSRLRVGRPRREALERRLGGTSPSSSTRGAT